ncbi:MAG: HAMP domain-containing protein [Chloroflexi bacterium]|nr:HAMP domain-containing protein [Chloroflexota bacterium]MCI0828870.1 HAMP domain-containing protein [Chloroflexota bacterium]MCI0897211.1 HAMP domain-containing protein [Chloroflexota bacterium]MCI0902921.1 HAMP domain-containing protein [Chloroflexota bacterium]
MNLPYLSRRQTGGPDIRPSFRLPKILIWADFSLSTKLILLVVIPLVLTLAATLPLTVTGLNRLASVTGTERLEDEIVLVNSHIELFEEQLNRAADDFARDPVLLAAVRESNPLKIKTILLSSMIRFGFQRLEVVDASGVRSAYEHQAGGTLGRKSMNELNALGLAGIGTNEMVQTDGGWFLVSVRPLKDLDGFIGSVAAGRLMDFKALAEMNFGRSNTILMLLGDDDEVVSTSNPSSDLSTRFPIAPDPESVRVARNGQIALGSAIIDGEKLRTAYVPVMVGGGSPKVFAVALTTSPVVALRDQLIASHVMVISALSLLVLGVGYVVTRTISRRIMHLRDGAVEIGNGNLSFRIEESAHDEMGTLAREFNRMSDRVKEKNAQLEEANRELEHRVSQRTEELQLANVQLLEAQGQLVRTEKFGALGELSAGVAHDLRNPLGAIRNGIYFLKSRLAKSDRLMAEPKVAEYLQVMDERITQCDKIIEDLISFTQISSPVYSAVTLSVLLESALSGIDIPDGVSVINDYGDGPVVVQADPHQLIRVFTNLIVNAHEAMLEGGELTIGVKTVGPSAEVTVTDTGTGISREGLEMIFEPLYTTKIRGTGLGLAVCQEVIAKHNGSLRVHSKVGVGTTFTVSLPLTPGGQ